MDINEMKEKRDALHKELNDLVSADSSSKAKEAELRGKIKDIQKPLAIEETQLIIEELELKERRGALNEKDAKKLAENRKKLEIIGG